MTITANDARKQTTATGGETSVAYDFLITDEDHLVVTRTRSGTDTVLAITTDYTVTGVDNDAGGTAELVVAAVAADVYTCERLVPQARTTDFADGGDFLADTVNDELDRIVSMIQEVARDVGRSLRLTDTDPTAGSNVKLGPVSSRASKYFAFDANGVPTFTSGTENAFVVSSFAETFLDDVDAESVRTTIGITTKMERSSAIDLTGIVGDITIESWVTRLTIFLNNVDPSAASAEPRIQLQYASGATNITSGYVGKGITMTGTTPTLQYFTMSSAFPFVDAARADHIFNAKIVVERLASEGANNIWSLVGLVYSANGSESITHSYCHLTTTQAVDALEIGNSSGGTHVSGNMSWIKEGASP